MTKTKEETATVVMLVPEVVEKKRILLLIEDDVINVTASPNMNNYEACEALTAAALTLRNWINQNAEQKTVRIH